jgi:hypothetical protein
MSSIGLLVGGAICILLSWAHVILSAEILPAGAFSSTLFGYALAVIFACLVSGWATDSLRGGLIRLLVIALWVGVLIGGVQAGAFLVLEQNGSSSLLGVALGTALGFALSFKHPRRTLAIFLCTSMAAAALQDLARPAFEQWMSCLQVPS